MGPVKVISLERSADRRAAFARNNSHLAYEWFNAVDGNLLTLADIAASGLFRPGLDYTAGAYGVALSHHALWREAAEKGETLTIAEDDAIFRTDFAEAGGRLLAGLSSDWDIVIWGFNFDSVLCMRLLEMPTVIGFQHELTKVAIAQFQSRPATPSLYRLDSIFGTPGYTISPAGARKFLAACFPIADFTRPVPTLPQPVRNRSLDIAMTLVYPAANSFVSFPPLVVTPNDRSASTIQNRRYISR